MLMTLKREGEEHKSTRDVSVLLNMLIFSIFLS